MTNNSPKDKQETLGPDLTITGRGVRITPTKPRGCISVETEVFINQNFADCLNWMHKTKSGTAYLMSGAPTRTALDHYDETPSFLLAVNACTGEALRKKELATVRMLTTDIAPNPHKAITIIRADGAMWLAWKIPDMKVILGECHA